MKPSIVAAGVLAASVWFGLSPACAQVLIVDQSSVPDGEVLGFGYLVPQASIVQSFTPAFSSVGFVQFQDLIIPDVSGGGVTVLVQLRDGGSLGPVIATTAALFLQNRATENTVFYFSDNIPITSGREYFLEPVVLGGGSLNLFKKTPSTYDRGELYLNGVPGGGIEDLWFREGIVVPVPEPCTICLFLLGAGVFLSCKSRRGF